MPIEQRMALAVLTAAAVIDGRLTIAERRLLREVQRVCGRELDMRLAERLRRVFVAGNARLVDALRSRSIY